GVVSKRRREWRECDRPPDQTGMSKSNRRRLAKPSGRFTAIDNDGAPSSPDPAPTANRGLCGIDCANSASRSSSATAFSAGEPPAASTSGTVAWSSTPIRDSTRVVETNGPPAFRSHRRIRRRAGDVDTVAVLTAVEDGDADGAESVDAFLAGDGARGHRDLL